MEDELWNNTFMEDELLITLLQKMGYFQS